MTTQHVFYIPTVFLLGFVFGIIFSENKLLRSANNSDGSSPDRMSKNKLLYTFLIFILVFIITHLFEIPWGSKQVSSLLNGQEIFDKKPLFSSDEVYTKIGTFSEEGLKVYQRFTYTVDIVFPTSFFVFLLTFAQFVAYRIKKSKLINRIITGLPTLWLITDLLENLIIYIILSNYPTRYDFLGRIIGVVSVIKFTLLFYSIITPVIFWIMSKRNTSNLYIN
ncbi:hypothetical protein [Runella slithyformis]|uniref:Uncharacterized protein n=1 Tax=Runella slithyformis (strain ATCC 29530 / DSM 19594 / LMG 11500 / NCIMB 11436 / LSU 4) TaxID=761193 RepID=A0A7U3ZRJ9_RUNSL|nr:hypothetical protein [Runella slithyformis]AEI52067.1 hypothetical protein Runsl_5931 [Runella slithyformis DSM 19594]